MQRYRLSVAIVALVSVTGCATYSERARTSFEYYDAGQFAKAAAEHQDIRVKNRDRLLYLMNQGMMLQAAGQYADSSRVLQQALHVAEQPNPLAIPAQAGSIASNDSVLPYHATHADLRYLHLLQILNFAALGEWESALVEIRRCNTLYPNLYRRPATQTYLQDAFSNYLSGLIWEATGHASDARIDYQTAEHLQPQPHTVVRDVARAQARSHGQGSSDPLFGRQTASIIIVVAGGRAPVKVPLLSNLGNETTPQLLTIPTYHDRGPDLGPVTVLLDQTPLGQIQTLGNVSNVVRGAFTAEELPGITARAILRLAAKVAATEAVSREVNEELGLLVGLAAGLSNTTDLRSFSTLPGTFALFRASIPPGHHDISLEIPTGHVMSGARLPVASQDFDPGKTYLFVRRIIQ